MSPGDRQPDQISPGDRDSQTSRVQHRDVGCAGVYTLIKQRLVVREVVERFVVIDEMACFFTKRNTGGESPEDKKMSLHNCNLSKTGFAVYAQTCKHHMLSSGLIVSGGAGCSQ